MIGSPFTENLKGEDKRRQMLVPAARIFTKKGFHKTTVDEIAAAVGVSKGTIYNHFKNKEDLYLAIFQEGVDIFHQQLVKAAAGPADPKEKLRRLIRGHFIFSSEEKDLFYLFLKELGSTDFSRELLAGILSKCLQVYRDVIREGSQKGVFRPLDPAVTASAVFGMLTITALHYLSYSRGIPLESTSGTLEDILFNGICY